MLYLYGLMQNNLMRCLVTSVTLLKDIKQAA